MPEQKSDSAVTITDNNMATNNKIIVSKSPKVGRGGVVYTSIDVLYIKQCIIHQSTRGSYVYLITYQGMSQQTPQQLLQQTLQEML